jgi:hypothetical protein
LPRSKWSRRRPGVAVSLRLDGRRFGVACGVDRLQHFLAQAEFGEGHSLDDRGAAGAPFAGENPSENDRAHGFVSPRLAMTPG